MTLLNIKSLSIVAAVALGATASVQAALVIDVRVANAADAKNITVAPGDVVTLNVYAVVTGANATADDGVQSLYGSFLSTQTGGGSATGDFSTFTAAAPFTANTQPGRVQDLNGQPGLDVGSPNASAPVSTDYVWARAAAVHIGATANPEFLVGTLTWTVTDAVGGGATSLNFDPRSNTNGTPLFAAAAWREDGVNKSPTAAGTSFAAGLPVHVTVPEPASLALVGLAATTLMSRRRGC